MCKYNATESHMNVSSDTENIEIGVHMQMYLTTWGGYGQ